jgi:hypothetical protein
LLNFPFPRGMIERVSNAERGAVRVFSEFICQITDGVK